MGSIFLSGHHGRHSGDAGTGGGNSEENSSFVSGGVGEKRTRFVEFFIFSGESGPRFCVSSFLCEQGCLMDQRVLLNCAILPLEGSKQ